MSNKVYMVSVPENADYAEWWYMVGLFSTKKKAQQFIKEHPIKNYRFFKKLKPRTRYDPIVEAKIDEAPLLYHYVDKTSNAGMDYSSAEEYFGKKGTKPKRY